VRYVRFRTTNRNLTDSLSALHGSSCRKSEHGALARRRQRNGDPHRGALVSLDAFRGFTMFWIVAQADVLALAALAPAAITSAVAFRLPTRRGRAAIYDLICLVHADGRRRDPFSFAKRSRSQTRGQIVFTAVKRAVVLFLLGSLRESLHANSPLLMNSAARFSRFALAYLAASLLAGRSNARKRRLRTDPRGVCPAARVCVCTRIAAGSYAKGANLVLFVDNAVLGVHCRRGGHAALRYSNNLNNDPRPPRRRSAPERACS